MSDNNKQKSYKVLARKYRPQNFDELVGQDALVRTLRNAIDSGRIAHAFMLTGVRGVGKTTTARIIAKALNYTGADGKSGPTSGNTDDCEICKAISEDRHPDVIEMDAASKTGIDDIREILDGVRYAPTSARYKIYIIDEVHMLSKQAFNALLKTLEEPPEHVKFILATTEIRKVPITVLSRCQKFELRRFDAETLSSYMKEICKKENVEIEDEAIAMIARAADGSARDGLSMLDQAIALGDGKVESEKVKEMLGLSDRTKILDLFEHSVTGESKKALEIMEDLYNAGADPVVMIQDMLAISHLMTKLKIDPDIKGSEANMAEDERKRAASLASQISMASIGRAWQILLKGLQEVSTAPNPQIAAEMVIIRLNYASNLPDPNSLIKKLKEIQENSVNSGEAIIKNSSEESQNQPVSLKVVGGTNIDEFNPNINNIEDVVALLRHHNDVILAATIEQYCHPVKIKNGIIEYRPAENTPTALAQSLAASLKRYTGKYWKIVISKSEGEPTISQKIQAKKQKEIDNVISYPIITKILEDFPKSEIISLINNENGEKLI